MDTTSHITKSKQAGQLEREGEMKGQTGDLEMKLTLWHELETLQQRGKKKAVTAFKMELENFINGIIRYGTHRQTRA